MPRTERVRPHIGPRIPLGKGVKVPTKKEYEEYLNENSPEQGSEEWIIGGTARVMYMWQKRYGTAIREYDPIAFMTGYNEFKLDKQCA